MYLILLFGLIFVLTMPRVLTKKLWDRGLSVTLRFRDSYIYEGDTSMLQEVVVNDKLLPLPALEVRLSMSPYLVFTGDAKDNTGISDQTYKRDVFSFLFHQQITRSLAFCGTRRGCYQIRQADVKSYDFFYRNCGYAAYPQDTVLYVYPAQVDSRRIDTICTAISGSVLVQNSLFPDPFEFCGIREYTPSDPMNRINWKASARMDQTMVNQFDSTTNLDLAIVFDLEDSRILKENALVEETIRIAASLTTRLIRQRMGVSLHSNASIPDYSGIYHKEVPAETGQIAQLNQQLACIDGTNASAVELLASITLTNEQLMVLISKNTNDGVLAAVRTLADASHPVLWVIPRHPADDEALPEIPYVHTLVWEVAQ